MFLLFHIIKERNLFWDIAQYWKIFSSEDILIVLDGRYEYGKIEINLEY